MLEHTVTLGSTRGVVRGALTSRAPAILQPAHPAASGRAHRLNSATPEAAESTSSAARAVVVLPGLGNNAADYAALAASLRLRGLETEVAAVGRPDWGRNALALKDGNWWRGTLKPRPAVDWYLSRVDAAVTSIKRRVGEDVPITLLTHSAGGWLGRVYMLDFGTVGIDRFVSLGSPHSPPPKGLALDQTRGILDFCSDACPGAFHSQVSYVTVAGKFVKGVPLRGQGTWQAKVAGAGYQQVCGEAEVWGDFIVPVASAHLEGAANVDLEGVFHSPLGAQLSFLGPWYGSPQVLEQWVGHVYADGEEVPDVGAVEAASVPAAAAAAASAL